MKPKRIRGDEIKRGDVYRTVQYSFDNRDLPEDRRYTTVADYDGEGGPHAVEVLGKAKEIKLPGLNDDTAWLFKRTLYVGCQKINALEAFKALGKALGYEVES